MAGRAFAFSDPRIIALAKTAFIPVCCDDWYQRRRQDDEGQFFRSVANQGPRKGANGSTRQGIYTFTADGTLLEFKNAGQDAEATLDQLKRALKKWNALPEEQRRPESVKVPEHGKPDAKYHRAPPAGGVILKVHGRILDAKDGFYTRGKCEATASMKASRDFLWITAEEAKSLMPTKPEVGFSYPLPPVIARRIARFHLVDNTRGEPNFWKSVDVKQERIGFTITGVSAETITLRINGEVLLQNAAGDRGYEAKLAGTMTIDRKKQTITGWDLAAVGDHWGDDSVTKSGCREGRTPFGIAFGLADPSKPAERVSPQAARDPNDYFKP